jgi:hypothetical protein
MDCILVVFFSMKFQRKVIATQDERDSSFD